MKTDPIKSPQLVQKCRLWCNHEQKLSKRVRDCNARQHHEQAHGLYPPTIKGCDGNGKARGRDLCIENEAAKRTSWQLQVHHAKLQYRVQTFNESIKGSRVITFANTDELIRSITAFMGEKTAQLKLDESGNVSRLEN